MMRLEGEFCWQLSLHHAWGNGVKEAAAMEEMKWLR